MFVGTLAGVLALVGVVMGAGSIGALCVGGVVYGAGFVNSRAARWRPAARTALVRGVVTAATAAVALGCALILVP